METYIKKCNVCHSQEKEHEQEQEQEQEQVAQKDATQVQDHEKGQNSMFLRLCKFVGVIIFVLLIAGGRLVGDTELRQPPNPEEFTACDQLTELSTDLRWTD